MGEFEHKLDGPHWGWMETLDGIKAEPDDICIFEHLRGSACHHMALLIMSLQDWAFFQMHM